MSEHTPGPWYVRYCDDALHMNMTVVSCMDWGDAHSGQYQGEPDTVCIVFHQIDPLVSDERVDFGEANACLVAATPDLLEALEMVRDADDDNRRDGLQTIPRMARAKIDAAIAKARGTT